MKSLTEEAMKASARKETQVRLPAACAQLMVHGFLVYKQNCTRHQPPPTPQDVLFRVYLSHPIVHISVLLESGLGDKLILTIPLTFFPVVGLSPKT